MSAPPLSVEPQLSVEHPETKSPPKLFTPGQILGVSLLGSVLAGAILLTINQRRMGERSLAWLTLTLGFVIVAVCIAIGIATDAGGHSFGFLPHLLAFGAYEMAKRDNAYHAAVAAGAQRASTWAALGVMALVLLGVVGAVVGYVWLGNPYGTKISAGKSSLYYVKGVTPDEAAKVERALVDDGYLKPDREADVQLRREHDGLTLVLITSWAHPTPEQLRMYQQVSDELDDALAPMRVKLALADESFDIQTRVPRLDREDFDKVKIFRFDGVTSAEARKLVDAMVAAGVIRTDQVHRYDLHRDGDGYMIWVGIKDGMWDDEKVVASYRELAAAASEKLGKRVRYRLCNGDLEPKKTVP